MRAAALLESTPSGRAYLYDLIQKPPKPTCWHIKRWLSQGDKSIDVFTAYVIYGHSQNSTNNLPSLGDSIFSVTPAVLLRIISAHQNKQGWKNQSTGCWKLSLTDVIQWFYFFMLRFAYFSVYIWIRWFWTVAQTKLEVLRFHFK